MSLHDAYHWPSRTPSRKGSNIKLNKTLQDHLDELEEQFTIPTELLHRVTDRFVSELYKGLTTNPGDVPMVPTWIIGTPDGNEHGSYLALDLGGTNLRVCAVEVQGNGKFDITQSKYRLPQELKVGTREALFDYIADCIKKFVEEVHPGKSQNLEIGFTFSYPCVQRSINDASLVAWTKGFDIDGVEGESVGPLLSAALKRVGCNNVRLNAILSDTTGTLVASNYASPGTEIGVIFGTGCNACYIEKFSEIPKLHKYDFPEDMNMIINCEWCDFDNQHVVLPRTKYDVAIDEESPRPGLQTYEKMIAGCYLGDILRRILLDLYEQGALFNGQDVTKIRDPLAMDTSVLSAIEVDPFENLDETQTLFEETYGLKTTEEERQFIRRACELIGTRSARLSACGVCALVRKMNKPSMIVGTDGSVYNLYPRFKDRLAQAFKDILGEEIGSKVVTIPAEDGSGVGAALVSALEAKGKALTSDILAEHLKN
ncbi:Hexokinase-1 [Schizosaccharomyces pombe]|uniref:Hexokinase-1 n=1 Tax=Schizosaccharomyces pombe (strain 972 / ATCC 24843) TaxID=284812 RepID=HXK1_SCHPO|nr:hexokinase 1 [Schizosaccharomyces pombe]Q09756.1 RecName: Full=Hexokinase-1 [Schizosaccharomyces pombe 972h-]CAA63487.1 hexokinase 1 [Schizosaccharomyces pombe]CAA90848.1 hexokinase 1 [Schizosaccharomyces pombe]|eukprot:NP_592948.1 hexokinase 1 [Schizosaccharomyces pombe]